MKTKNEAIFAFTIQSGVLFFPFLTPPRLQARGLSAAAEICYKMKFCCKATDLEIRHYSVREKCLQFPLYRHEDSFTVNRSGEFLPFSTYPDARILITEIYAKGTDRKKEKVCPFRHLKITRTKEEKRNNCKCPNFSSSRLGKGEDSITERKMESTGALALVPI